MSLATSPIADGRADGDYSELQAIIGQTARLVLWQMPAVAIIGGLVIWLLPSEWAPLRGPLACVVVAFILTFPLRMFNAILQGRQDLAFLGGVQLMAWTAGAAVTVAGVAAGLGLYSLAFGWVTTQCVTAFVAWRRLMTVHRDVLPARLPALAFSAAKNQIGSSAWISVNQIAQVLLGGTDLVVIGKLLGPEAIVPYVCTGKLLTLLANQPQMFMQMALPALSELQNGCLAGLAVRRLTQHGTSDAAAQRRNCHRRARRERAVRRRGGSASRDRRCRSDGAAASEHAGSSHERHAGLHAVLFRLRATARADLGRRRTCWSGAAWSCSFRSSACTAPYWGRSPRSVWSACQPTFSRWLVRKGDHRAGFSGPWDRGLIRCVAVVAGVAAVSAFADARGLWSFVPLAMAVGAAYLLVMLPVI